MDGGSDGVPSDVRTIWAIPLPASMFFRTAPVTPGRVLYRSVSILLSLLASDFTDEAHSVIQAI